MRQCVGIHGLLFMWLGVHGLSGVFGNSPLGFRELCLAMSQPHRTLTASVGGGGAGPENDLVVYAETLPDGIPAVLGHTLSSATPHT